MKIQKAAEMEMNSLKVLLYGAPGTGKTYCLRTLPKPILVFDFDKGMLTNKGIDGVEYVVYNADNPKDPNVYREFQKDLIATDGYPCIAIDSLSGLNEAVINYCMKLQGKPTKSPTMQDWGVIGAAMSQLMNVFRSLPPIVVITAHSRSERNDQTGGIKTWPSVTGNVRYSIGKYFDEMYITTKRRDKLGKTEYVFDTQGDNNHPAKSRLSASVPFERYILPDFKELLQKGG